MKSVSAKLCIWAFGSMVLAGCTYGVPLKEPDIVTRQAERSGTLRVGESSAADVRAALGDPLLQSRYWSLDVFQTEDLQKELEFFLFFTPPIPMGVFTTKVSGYVLVTYDNKGLVSNVVSGTATKTMGKQDGLMLKAGDLNFVIEEFDGHGPQLIVQSARLQDYFALQHDIPECILVLACELPKTSGDWFDMACPDRVIIDAGEVLDPQSLFTACEPDTCPETAVTWGGAYYMHVPLLYPVALSSGRHQLELSSSIFKGRDISAFECDSGQVLYGSIHGSVAKHWWGPRSSTLNVSVSVSDAPPPNWRSYSALLYRRDHWLLPDPGGMMQ